MNTKPLFKALGLVFALLLVFTFSACSDDDTGGGGDTTAPTWTAAPAPSGTAGTNTAAISCTLNEAGTVYWKVMANGAEPPSSSQVTNDNNSLLISAATPLIINLTGLNANTAYDVFVVAKDTAGNLQTAPRKVDVQTASSGGGDSTAPAWTADPAVFGTPETNTAYVAYTLDEECTVHYVVLPSGATAPSAADVKTNGNRAYNSVGVQDQVYLQDLSTGTTYNVYFVATDAANNDSVVKMAVVTTASGGGDTTPPSWSSAPALSGSATTNAAAIVLTTDEDATVYYQILADGSPAPTSVYLRDNAPNIAATGGSPATITLTGLTAGTAYDVYIVARDASGNLQASPTLVEFTTASGSGDTTYSLTLAGVPTHAYADADWTHTQDAIGDPSGTKSITFNLHSTMSTSAGTFFQIRPTEPGTVTFTVSGGIKTFNYDAYVSGGTPTGTIVFDNGDGSPVSFSPTTKLTPHDWLAADLDINKTGNVTVTFTMSYRTLYIYGIRFKQ